MMKHVLIAVGASVCLAGPVSALTFTPTNDDRRTHAGAVAGIDKDIQNDSPGGPLADFSSDLWASASDQPNWDVFANGHASQSSSIGAASISGSGFVSANGGHGILDGQTAPGISAITGPVGSFEAAGESILQIVFSIDMDAHFDLRGFIGAGIEEAAGDLEEGSKQIARIQLFDIDNGVSVFEESVSNSGELIDTSGHIGPGSYRFTAEALASVFGGMDNDADSGDADTSHGGYAANARFEEVQLTLTGRDKPIPEPVTASLAFFGLGALGLYTSRRRRA